MTRDQVIAKIKKCLRLSASSNANEAETALRQARALMEKYDIDQADMLASDAGESAAKAGAKFKPAVWESHLAAKVADAFGCDLIFSPGFINGRWLFIGCDPGPEIAGYAFSVLYRQCKRARAVHIKTALKRCSPAATIRRADVFCLGWVAAVSAKIKTLVPNEKQQLAIQAFIGKNHPSTTSLNPIDRNAGRNLQPHDRRDMQHGFEQGQNAELNRGVSGTETLALGVRG